MSREARLFLEDIQEACGRIARYTKGLSREEFELHDLHYDGCLRQLLVIGEAAKHLPDEIREMADVQWTSIAGMRDVIAHGYFSLNDATLWWTCTERVPELGKAVDAILSRLASQESE